MRAVSKFFAILPLLIFALFIQAETITLENSGFVPGNIWLSKTPTSVGEEIKIYTMVWNGSTNDVSGTVTFFDNDQVIDKQNFILSGEGSSKILFQKWTAATGYHKLYAQITDSVGGPRGSKAITVSLQYSKTSEEEHFIDTPKVTEPGKTTLVNNIVGSKIDFAKGYVEANLPKPVTGTTKAISGNLETMRVNANEWSNQVLTKIKNDLNPSDIKLKYQTSTNKNSGFSVERPIKYVELFLLSVMAFIFGQAWIFYGVLIILVFFVLRYFKRKFFF